ncbi:p53-induced protein 8 [Volvox carteri f. nagariensis]|uniref:p53-induced protein 8 n=1 Tax=Volvox carteri f. nagariensis TaxID=3068 RepID=D8U9P3_VOLCA|nr:p53-induced protein 8 [Volvox carteri f. nagariensis]EFJ43446.1 p53-induced protein 8 [Volvox carteri f. nagariensis]|eukprot:XP_002955375.1 p53-induced protein 8 [Volvox carteri f. nagariensis]
MGAVGRLLPCPQAQPQTHNVILLSRNCRILVWESALAPAASWLLRYLVAPCLGSLPARGAEVLLQLAYQALWLLPVYLVTMFISCGIYNDIAQTAYLVKQQQQQQQERKGAPAAPPGPSHRGQPPGGSGGLENVAQEVYRVVLFCVFFAEVSTIGRLPYVGYTLNVLFLSWLYAYYCFDYKWGLQGVRLPERLAYFERRWAFFAGFGLPMALSTVLLSFYPGAAVLAILFPVYILVSCDSDVNAVHDRVVGKAATSSLRHLPIFALALWPTQRIVQLLTGGSGAPLVQPVGVEQNESAGRST